MRLQHWLPCCLLVALLTTVGCTRARMAHNLPPSQRLMEPGPGVGGPGPGVIPVPGQQMGAMSGGMAAMQASYVDDGGYMGAGCMDGGGGMGMGCNGMPGTSQISFLGEEPLTVTWDIAGNGCFDGNPLYVPGKQDFYQGAVYRLKVTNLPGRETVQLYPTLEVAPVTPRTDAYLAHAPIPVQFTEEDFDQVLSGNFVTKVIYLPDPEFTEIALAGVETLVSTRLDPGIDPISEADRRGSILAILRMGNKDLSRTAGMMNGYGPGGMGPGGECITPAQYSDGEYMAEGQYGPTPMEGQYMGEQYMGEEYMGEQYMGDEYAGPQYMGEGSYGGCEGGSCPNGGCYGGDGGYAMSQMPMGSPTSGMGPRSVPPHMVANMAPGYGMPITGTPIGLPGPPHIPLGVPAGLKSHSMRNRTRVVLPGPVEDFKMTVKQRPGMNYPAPVDKVRIDEVNRAPAQCVGGTVQPLVPAALSRSFQHLKSSVSGMAGASSQGDYCP